MSPRQRTAALLALLVGAALAVWLAAAGAPRIHSGPATRPERIVALAPAITETLFALGVGSKVVGISDYCKHPRESQHLPRLGTALTPNLERIARIQPDLIVSEAALAGDKKHVDALAPVLRLPWLSLNDITSSVRRMGEVVGAADAATALADRLQRRLSVAEPVNGPRVLLVLANDTETVDPVWFLRRNSIHGSALHAAGGRNAIAEDVPGLPRTSLERVLTVDPDVIILLTGAQTSDPRRARLLADWQRLTALRAVQARRLYVIDGDAVFSNGPRILQFADQLQAVLGTQR